MNSEDANFLKKSKIYEFGEYRLEVENLLLLRKSEVVPLAPKACEVLIALVESGGQMVSKQEILERVWADTFVEEANLTHHISALRKALGDDKNGKKFIETIPRRGYRFVAHVSETSNGMVEITFSEHNVMRTIEEEEIETDETPVGQTLQKEKSNSLSRFSPKTVLLLGFAALLLVTIGIAALRFFPKTENKKQGVAALRIVPVTTYTGHELESSISPDGKFVAFAGTDISNTNRTPYATLENSYFNIYIKQADGESILQITNKTGRAISPAWSPDSRFIAYAHKSLVGGSDGALYIIPALGGAERKIHEAPDLAFVAWSPDGKTLAFTARKDAQSPRCLFTIVLETRAVKQITFSTDGDDNRPTFSPDGSTISFTRTRDKTSEVFLVSTIGGEARQVTKDNGYISGRAAWTPDGKKLIFGSNRTGTYRLWQIPIEGGEAQLLNDVGEPAFDPSISANGTRLTYTRADFDFNIWRVPLENRKGVSERGEKIIASSRTDRCPAISPNSERISFVSNQNGAAREVWLSDGDGANQRQLTTFGDVAIVTRTAWSPDGMRLAFDATTKGESAIYVLNVESGVPQRLTDERVESLSPSWSRDGHSIYFGSNRNGAWQVWKVAGVGGEPVQVTNNGGYEAHESADGQFLYFNKAGYGTVGIFRQPISGGAEEKVFDLLQVDSIGEWAITESGIFFFHRAETSDKATKQPGIRFFDFATKQITDVLPLSFQPMSNPCLEIAPDGKWLYYSQNDKTEVDIMMVENFD